MSPIWREHVIHVRTPMHFREWPQLPHGCVVSGVWEKFTGQVTFSEDLGHWQRNLEELMRDDQAEADDVVPYMQCQIVFLQACSKVISQSCA